MLRYKQAASAAVRVPGNPLDCPRFDLKDEPIEGLLEHATNVIEVFGLSQRCERAEGLGLNIPLRSLGHNLRLALAHRLDLSVKHASRLGKPKSDTRHRATAWVKEALGPLRESVAPDPPSVLTLGPAAFWPFGGKETVELPAVRIALDSVEAWCLVVGKVTAEKGGTWFNGGAISDPLT
jgi:hypothetical protein